MNVCHSEKNGKVRKPLLLKFIRKLLLLEQMIWKHGKSHLTA